MIRSTPTVAASRQVPVPVKTRTHLFLLRLLVAGLALQMGMPALAQGQGPGAAQAPVITATPTQASTQTQSQSQPPSAIPAEAKAPERNISEWLARMHEASRRRAYIGTFVVSSGTSMSSAKIWHVCDGDQQLERVETLTGAPRSTFRRNDQVITFHGDSKTALVEKRESMGLFPNLLKSGDSSLAQFYVARQTGSERVAGFDADVVQLAPKDAHRYGYRVWSEKKSGLVMKLQTLDAQGRVLEQAAFSDLQLDAPVSMAKLTQMMGNTDGYKVEKPELVKTTALAEGWVLKNPVAGFKPMSCHKRVAPTAQGTASESTLQWIFSDGLASVSVFIEAFDRQRHVQEGLLSMGATQMLTRRFTDRAGDKSVDKSAEKGPDWWLTVVGEVPPQTLNMFTQGLERKK
jgi:sigma-E factor negative regulatory protein RseB